MDPTRASFTREGDCVTRCVAGETIVVPIRSHVADLESIFTLNEVATSIWDRLDGTMPVRRIVEEICEEYDVTPEEAEADAIAFLGRLRELELIAPA